MNAHEQALLVSLARARRNNKPGTPYADPRIIVAAEKELADYRASLRPVAKAKKPPGPPAPIVTVVDPDLDDDDDDDEDEPDEIFLDPADRKPAKTRTKTLGGVTFEAPHVEPVHIHMLPTKPSTKELVAKAAGMPPELARGLTEAEVCKLAPNWKRSK